MLPRTLRAQVVVFITMVIATVMAFHAWQTWDRSSATVQSAETARIRSIATTLASHIDGDVIARALAEHPTRDAISDWAQVDPDVAREREKLVEALLRNELESPVYILSPVAGQSELVFSLTTAERPYWCHTYPLKAGMIPTLLHGEIGVTDVYHDAHGSWVSAYAPVRRADGSIVGLLQVDAPLESLLAALKIQMESYAFTGSLLLILVIVLVRGFAVRFGRRLETLTGVARRLSRGDYHVPIQVSGPRELEEVGVAFERAREQILLNEQKLRDEKRQVQELLDEKNEFLMTISHEFRTPMNGILGATELLRDSDLSHGQRAQLGVLEVSGRRMQVLVERILTLAGLVQGSVRVESHPFDLRETLESDIEQWRGRARGRENQLTVQWPDPLPRFVGDANHIRVILEELIDNAIKFTDGGNIECRVEVTAEGLQLEVSDEGPGFTAGDDAFEWFTQESRGDDRTHEGTGIGLTIIKGLVDAMQGALAVAPREPRGTKITIRIPLAVHVEDPAVRDEAHRAEILVCEDEPSTQRLMKMFLNKEGQNVTVAKDGQEGLELFQEAPERWELVLMDLQMPVMDGFTAAMEIRRVGEAGARVPIVAVTADTRPDTERRCAAAGMNGYCAKPIRRQTIRALIEEYALDPSPAA